MSSTERGRSNSPSGTGARPTRSLYAPKKLKYSTLKTQLREAAKDTFAAGYPTKYRQVNVVMLHFDNDDMGVESQEDELAETFEKEYKLAVHKVLLPGKSIPNAALPEETVTAEFAKLRKQKALKEDYLAILVFSGHGLIINDMLEWNYLWHELPGPQLSWMGAWASLFKSACSVLHILDCCYAVQATHPSVETLAAASPTERGSSKLATSFTQAVYKQLQFMDTGKAFSVSEFTASLIADRESLGLITFPVYVKRKGRHSIVINKPVDPAKPELVIKAKTNNPRILIAANVEGDLAEKDLEDLKVYLTTRIPHCVKNLEITLEGFRESTSSVLELNLPAAVWLQLPTDEPAYTYIAEVKTFTSYAQTSLVAVPTSPTFLATLTPRVPTGDENVKPGGTFK